MVEDYLTEKLLGQFLEERFHEEFVHDKVVPNSDIKLRPDYRCDKLKLIVEFDGYYHYNNSKIILNDYIKDNCYRNLEYSIIRIPYFIQLDYRVINLLFSSYDINKDSFNSYPHGFVDKVCLLPSDFNYVGIERFKKDLLRFSIVKAEIEKSLKDKLILYREHELVVPPTLHNLLV